ncbi:MAG TPA: ABC transporter substrate-binding protein [Gaiellaceae bacterium]|nr:ABC transporter substrate-binding protein [Gaiellaceae bacterium]
MRWHRVARAAGPASAAAALTLVVAVSAGAGTKATPPIRNGGTLVVSLAEEPDALDPTLARTFVGRIVFLHMCEKLYDLNAKLHIVPQLAAALPQVSRDKLTYRIGLRGGIRFNDGTPFNAAAVKQSLERHLTLKGSTRASEISPIASVDTAGPRTVVLHLKTPFSPLTAQLADRAGMVMSPKAMDALGDKFATNPVCVGPFEFKSRVAGDRITLEKSNDYYGRSKVHLAQIVFKIITDPNARTQNLRAGDSQVLDRVQSTDVPTLRRDSSVRVIRTPTIGYQGLTLNIGNKNGLLKGYSNVGTPLARSQFLRTAFDLALDRTVINRVVFSGLNLPDCYPISPVSPWYVTTKGLDCNLHANVATARKLVKASNIDTPIKVQLTIGTDPVAARLGQVIQAMEKAVGFDVQLKPTEFVSALNQADAGRFETFAVGWSGRVDPDGNIYGFVATPGTLNDSGFSDQKLDFILNNARRSVTQKSRITLYSAAMKIIHRQRPLIYLYHPVNYYGVSKKVSGVKVYGDGLIRAGNAGFLR